MIQCAKNPLLFTLVIAALLGQRCQAGGLLGLWQTETNQWRATGHTNRIEVVETIQFFGDNSLKVTEVTVADGKRWTIVPYTGTYSILTTNRASLKFIPQNIPTGATARSLTVSCSIVGDELEFPKLITSVVPENKRYRRVK